MPPEIPAPADIRHVHFVAACGTGMGSLACMLAEQGYRVTGSDAAAYPPMSDQLRAAGIVLEKGFAPEHALRDRPDLAVIGNAVRPDNPEAQAVIEAGVPYMNLPDALRHFFIHGKHSVVIAGTHGKTTCTSLVGQILAHAGLDPGVLVGGVTGNFDGSYRIGAGPHFVVEGDEYDSAFFDKTPKFLHYEARSVLFTSCEFDHADIYESFEAVKRSFEQLVADVPEDGCIVAATDVPAVAEIARGSRAPVESYGFQEEALWKASDVVVDAERTQFTVWRGDERLARARVPLHGRHNVENVLGSIALCTSLGVDPETACSALELFAGVKRRQELRGEVGGMAVIDDFAHHPTAVRETLASMRTRFPDRELWAVFEPRTNTSRRRHFEDDYVEALSGADRVVLAGVYRAEQIDEDERMRPDRVAAQLVERGVDAIYLPEIDDIIDRLVRHRSGRDVALIMSNGEFGGIWEHLLTRLRKAES
ncbi:MAG: UDP-N-acetylmuramate:L-alanyl-gamma-D-glutamyl-meso-diaminopimelate ligase [Deltaproteobacteria bacterium]|nr:UDP-N-acetylmuramate:L-alanyl-gamma-D-glutamyl-meso-diaminopimelate ligase [Deltaproteobacteria bacterium]